MADDLYKIFGLQAPPTVKTQEFLQTHFAVRPTKKFNSKKKRGTLPSGNGGFDIPVDSLAPTIDLATGSDLGDSSTDNFTSDNLPEVDITSPVSWAVGDIFYIYDNLSLVFQHTVTADDILGATIPFSLSALSDGAHSLRCRRSRGGIITGFGAALVITIDSDTPNLSSQSGSATSDITAVVFAISDKASGSVYVVVTESTTQPSAQNIIDGLDHTDVSAVYASSVTAIVGANSFLVTGLDQGTTYYAHFVQKDRAGNVSTRVTTASFTTTSAFSAEANAIFSAFTTPPTDSRKALINAVLEDLVAAGVWDKLDALYVFAAADSQAALINWKNPGTYNATLVNGGGLVFTVDRGIAGDGTGYIDSNFVPSTAAGQFLEDSCHEMAYCMNDRTTFGFMCLIGTSRGTNTNYTHICPLQNGNSVEMMTNNTSNMNPGGISTTRGVIVNTRTADNARAAYRNGSSTAITTDTGASDSGVSNTSIVMLAYRASGIVGRFTTDEIGAASIGAGLNGTEAAALMNAVNTYMTALSQNVY